MNNTVLPLQRQLEEEADLMGRFIQALQDEALALTEPNDNEALDVSTQQKNRYADQLAASARQRHDRLAALGYSADRSGLDAAALAWPELQAPSQALYEQARQAHDLNTTNGAIINTFLEHNQRAIDTLQQLAGLGNLYDASGRTHALLGNKKSIKAG